MKALTVKQPWAWAIMDGRKHVENRTWKPVQFKQIAIHSAKVDDLDALDDPILWAALERALVLKDCDPQSVMRDLGPMAERGALLGTVNVDSYHHATTCDLTCSPWAQAGCWHWMLTNPQPIEPVPYKGALGLWHVPRDIELAHFAGCAPR